MGPGKRQGWPPGRRRTTESLYHGFKGRKREARQATWMASLTHFLRLQDTGVVPSWGS